MNWEQIFEQHPELLEELKVPSMDILANLMDGKGSPVMRRNFEETVATIKERYENLNLEEPTETEKPEEESNEPAPPTEETELAMFWKAVLDTPVDIASITLPDVPKHYDHTPIVMGIAKRLGIKVENNHFIPGNYIDL